LPAKPKHTLTVLLLITAAFIYGLAHLLSLRFESGDIYPAYSSLRSDPQGTRALYDSLDKLEMFSLRRNYLPLSQVKFKAPTTFLYIGSGRLNSKYMEKRLSDAIERLTDGGGRLVLAFRPVHRLAGSKESDDTAEGCQKEVKQPSDPGSGQESTQSPKQATGNGDDGSQKPEGKPAVDQPNECSAPDSQTVAVEDLWGVRFRYDRPNPERSYARVAPGRDADILPHEISWHTDLVFEISDSRWEVLYRRDEFPVIVERPFRQGTILLVADAYLFSNEALRAERHPALLTRIIGSNNRIVFDEGHFGIYKIPGIAELIRTHGLHWFFGGIALIFILFVWKNSVPFVPPADDVRNETGNGGSQARDIFQGLISLLRRNIPAKDILKVCLNEWKKSFDVEERLRAEQLAKIIAVADSAQTVSENKIDPVEGYLRIRRILSEGEKNE